MSKPQKIKTKKHPPLKRITILTVTIFIISIFIVSGAFAGVALGFANRSLPFIRIGNFVLGNLSRQDLIKVLNDRKPQELKISAEQEVLTIKPSDIDLVYDPILTAERLISLSKLEQLVVLAPLREHVAVFSYNEQKLDAILNRSAKTINVDAKNASLEIKKGKLLILDKVTSGRALATDRLKEDIFNRYKSYDFSAIGATVEIVAPIITGPMIESSLAELSNFLEKGLNLTVADEQFKIDKPQLLTFLTLTPKDKGVIFEPNKEIISAYIKTLAKQTDQLVKDANLKMVDGKVEVFQASQQGKVMDKDKAIQAIIQALKSDNRVVQLPVKLTDPKVTTASVNDLGIQELIGSGTTNFKGSPENRKHNISTGAGVLNGILIGPDQVFSTIEALGNPDAESGYLPELVIKENKTIPEFGGGLCQVSTTLFRAIMNAGLPINERQNHSWRISYYEPPVGLDATVYFPRPDLKFKNDTPSWLLIQSKIEGTKITFDIFGTKDGRRSEVSNKLLSSTKPPAPVYVDSDTVPRGTTKQVEKPHPGGRAVATYKVFDKDGNLVNDQTFASSYKAVPARFLVGTGEPARVETPAAQTPAPETQPAQQGPPAQTGQVSGEQTQQ